MKRRNFLHIAAGLGGSCIIPVTIARRIQDICLGNSDALILAPEHFDLEIYAQESFGSYILHLGDPNVEPCYPTLREFIETKGYSPDDRRSLRDYLIDWRSYDISTEGRTKHAIDEIKELLDEPIEGYELDHWMDWDFETSEGTMPQAYHYLSELPLDDGSKGGDFNLGSLSFIEGDRPGSNLTYVEADSLAAVASLQHRLNELQTGARIIVDC
jgi:hypothetical protein